MRKSGNETLENPYLEELTSISGIFWVGSLAVIFILTMLGGLEIGGIRFTSGTGPGRILLIISVVLAINIPYEIWKEKGKEYDVGGEDVEPGSVEAMAMEADGDIQPAELAETSKGTETLLFGDALKTHLKENEQPQYYFRNGSRGFRITAPDGSEKTPHHSWNSWWSKGHRHLLITDERVLYVAASDGEDEVMEFPYDDIIEVTETGLLSNDRIVFRDNSETEYKFVTKSHRGDIGDAITYIRNQIHEGSDASGSSPTGPQKEESTLEHPADVPCPECDSRVQSDANFCQECGSELSGVWCPECEDHYEEEPNFCQECGFEFKTTVSDSSVHTERNGEPDDAVDDETDPTRESRTDIEADFTKDQPAEEAESEKEQYPLLSYFAAVMLFWGGANALSVHGRVGEFMFFIILGVLVIPEVRRFVVSGAQDSIEVDLTGQTIRAVVGGVYVLMVGAVAMIMVGGAANDPEMSAGAGVGALLIAGSIAWIAERITESA